MDESVSSTTGSSQDLTDFSSYFNHNSKFEDATNNFKYQIIYPFISEIIRVVHVHEAFYSLMNYITVIQNFAQMLFLNSTRLYPDFSTPLRIFNFFVDGLVPRDNFSKSLYHIFGCYILNLIILIFSILTLYYCSKKRVYPRSILSIFVFLINILNQILFGPYGTAFGISVKACIQDTNILTITCSVLGFFTCFSSYIIFYYFYSIPYCSPVLVNHTTGAWTADVFTRCAAYSWMISALVPILDCFPKWLTGLTLVVSGFFIAYQIYDSSHFLYFHSQTVSIDQSITISLYICIVFAFIQLIKPIISGNYQWIILGTVVLMVPLTYPFLNNITQKRINKILYELSYEAVKDYLESIGQSRDLIITEDIKKAYFDTLKFFGIKGLLQYLRLGVGHHCELFIDFSFSRYLLEFYKQKEIVIFIGITSAFFPTADEILSYCISIIEQIPDLSPTEEFTFYMLQRIRISRQTDNCAETRLELKRLQKLTNLTSYSIRSFWNEIVKANKETSMLVLASIYSDTQKAKTQFIDAVDKYNNNESIIQEYVSFLIETCGSYQQAIKWYQKAQALKDGKRVFVDYTFKYFVQTFPEYLTKKIVDTHGRFLHGEDVTSNSENWDSSDSSTDLGINVNNEEAINQMFDHGHLRLSIEQTLKSITFSFIDNAIFLLFFQLILALSIYIFVLLYFPQVHKTSEKLLHQLDYMAIFASRISYMSGLVGLLYKQISWTGDNSDIVDFDSLYGDRIFGNDGFFNNLILSIIFEIETQSKDHVKISKYLTEYQISHDINSTLLETETYINFQKEFRFQSGLIESNYSDDNQYSLRYLTSFLLYTIADSMDIQKANNLTSESARKYKDDFATVLNDFLPIASTYKILMKNITDNEIKAMNNKAKITKYFGFFIGLLGIPFELFIWIRCFTNLFAQVQKILLHLSSVTPETIKSSMNPIYLKSRNNIFSGTSPYINRKDPGFYFILFSVSFIGPLCRILMVILSFWSQGSYCTKITYILPISLSCGKRLINLVELYSLLIGIQTELITFSPSYAKELNNIFSELKTDNSYIYENIVKYKINTSILTRIFTGETFNQTDDANIQYLNNAIIKEELDMTLAQLEQHLYQILGYKRDNLNVSTLFQSNQFIFLNLLIQKYIYPALSNSQIVFSNEIIYFINTNNISYKIYACVGIIIATLYFIFEFFTFQWDKKALNAIIQLIKLLPPLDLIKNPVMLAFISGHESVWGNEDTEIELSIPKLVLWDSPIATLYFSPIDLVVKSVNPAFQQITGLAIDQVNGQPLSRIIPRSIFYKSQSRSSLQPSNSNIKISGQPPPISFSTRSRTISNSQSIDSITTQKHADENDQLNMEFYSSIEKMRNGEIDSCSMNIKCLNDKEEELLVHSNLVSYQNEDKEMFFFLFMENIMDIYNQEKELQMNGERIQELLDNYIPNDVRSLIGPNKIVSFEFNKPPNRNVLLTISLNDIEGNLPVLQPNQVMNDLKQICGILDRIRKSFPFLKVLKKDIDFYVCYFGTLQFDGADQNDPEDEKEATLNALKLCFEFKESVKKEKKISLMTKFKFLLTFGEGTLSAFIDNEDNYSYNFIGNSLEILNQLKDDAYPDKITISKEIEETLRSIDNLPFQISCERIDNSDYYFVNFNE